jgi:hypothetical protein
MMRSIDLQPFRDELEQLYLAGQTHQQLAHWLADRGLVIAPGTFQNRFKDWAMHDLSTKLS